jgi:hypothetical protein
MRKNKRYTKKRKNEKIKKSKRQRSKRRRTKIAKRTKRTKRQRSKIVRRTKKYRRNKMKAGGGFLSLTPLNNPLLENVGFLDINEIERTVLLTTPVEPPLTLEEEKHEPSEEQGAEQSANRKPIVVPYTLPVFINKGSKTHYVIIGYEDKYSGVLFPINYKTWTSGIKDLNLAVDETRGWAIVTDLYMALEAIKQAEMRQINVQKKISGDTLQGNKTHRKRALEPLTREALAADKSEKKSKGVAMMALQNIKKSCQEIESRYGSMAWLYGAYIGRCRNLKKLILTQLLNYESWNNWTIYFIHGWTHKPNNHFFIMRDRQNRIQALSKLLLEVREVDSTMGGPNAVQPKYRVSDLRDMSETELRQKCEDETTIVQRDIDNAGVVTTQLTPPCGSPWWFATILGNCDERNLIEIISYLDDGTELFGFLHNARALLEHPMAMAMEHNSEIEMYHSRANIGVGIIVTEIVEGIIALSKMITRPPQPPPSDREIIDFVCLLIKCSDEIEEFKIPPHIREKMKSIHCESRIRTDPELADLLASSDDDDDYDDDYDDDHRSTSSSSDDGTGDDVSVRGHPWIYKNESEANSTLIKVLSKYNDDLSESEITQILEELGLQYWVDVKILMRDDDGFEDWFMSNVKMVIGTRKLTADDMRDGTKGYYWWADRCNWYNATLKYVQDGSRVIGFYPVIDVDGNEELLDLDDPLEPIDSDFLVSDS